MPLKNKYKEIRTQLIYLFTVLFEPKFKISNVTKTKLPQVECKYYRSYLKYYIPKQILREQNNKYKN
jgi:hypothetical protein